MASAPEEPLARYWSKRDFSATSEPRGAKGATGPTLSFVIQKHHASRLHYDFRLELDGVLLSWAMPKGPSYDPADKRMAIHVEDHPLSYGSFEGTIPPRQYGAGTVIVWDNGTWQPTVDPHAGLKDGKLVFGLDGQKMFGLWELVRIAKPGDRQEAWLLFKKRDAFARPHSEYDVVSALPDSVIAKPLRARAPPIGAPGDAGLPGAVKAPMPEKLPPQLATLAAAPPSSADWCWEIKLDGYRLMARIQNGKVSLITRGGHDWSAKMPGLVEQLQGFGLSSAWFDGEIVVLGDSGVPDFNALQNAFDRARTDSIVYFLFDVPYFEGHDLRKAPLVSRRQLLRNLLDEKATDHIRFSATFDADAASILGSARRMGLEGVMAKRKDSAYESRRTETWLKVKFKLRQEFVVAGYTDRSSGEAEIGSLLLGVHDDRGALGYVGNVGTGWTADVATKLKVQLAKLGTAESPFPTTGLPRKGRWSTRAAGAEHWVRPRLVAEVEFAEWTPDGHIRHARFLGLRTDKGSKEITREKSVAPPDAQAASGSAGMSGGIKVTHPDRVVDPSTGITKLELVRYYESIAGWMLPHLKGRPCSLVRAPSGIGGELFFQKHTDSPHIPEIRSLDADLWPGHEPLLEVSTRKALAGAAQMNVIEFHTWNALVRNIDKPDRMIFDIDPGDGVGWERIQEAATLTRAMLAELGLQCWLKTSGGKGLHVVVPLTPRHDWDTVKGFAQAVVQHLARVIPGRFVAKSGPSNRVGKIFIDYLRNGHGATTAVAFSARARPGLGVSMPVSWDELKTLKKSDQWTVRTAREHVSFQTVDPWAEYWTTKQTLTGAMKVLGFRMPAGRA